MDFLACGPACEGLAGAVELNLDEWGIGARGLCDLREAPALHFLEQKDRATAWGELGQCTLQHELVDGLRLWGEACGRQGECLHRASALLQADPDGDSCQPGLELRLTTKRF